MADLQVKGDIRSEIEPEKLTEVPTESSVAYEAGSPANTIKPSKDVVW